MSLILLLVINFTFLSASSTLTLAPPDSPRQEWTIEHKALELKNNQSEQSGKMSSSCKICSCTSQIESLPPLLQDTPAATTNMIFSVAERQIYEKKIEQMQQEIKFVNQKNAELEMNSIITFAAMSHISPTVIYPTDYSLSVHSTNSHFNQHHTNYHQLDQERHQEAAQQTDQQQHNPLLLKPTPKRKLFESVGTENHPAANSFYSSATNPLTYSSALETISQLQDKISKLEYVSRLWDRYMFNLTLLQKQNKDLRQELEEHQAKERREREARLGIVLKSEYDE